MKRFAIILALLMFSAPAYAWRTAIGGRVGIIDDETATALHLEFEEMNSHVHVQPRVQFWAPEDKPGIWEIGLDVYYHVSPCASVSPYIGGGVGGEWLPSVPVVVVRAQPPVQVDPPSPIGVLIGGIRLPGARVDT